MLTKKNDWENFPNAPILEAIIDIRIEPAGEDQWSFDVSDFSQLLTDYPSSSKIYFDLFRTPLAVGATSSELQQKILGLRFENSAAVVQCRLDGFTFNQLAPYESWEAMVAKAWSAWTVYKGLMNRRSVVRLAVRYINLFTLAPAERAEDYFTATLTPPRAIPYHLTGSFCRYEMKVSDQVAAAVIQQTEPLETGQTNCFLDIEAYCDGAYSIEDQAIFQLFEQLRNVKNEIFQGSLTEAAKSKWR